MHQESIQRAIDRRITQLGDELHILRSIESLVSEFEDHYPGMQVTVTDISVCIIVPLRQGSGEQHRPQQMPAFLEEAPEGETHPPLKADVPPPSNVIAEPPSDAGVPSRKTGAYSPEEDARIRSMWEAGSSLIEIAAALGRHEQSLSNRFYSYIKPTLDVPARKPHWTPEEDDRVVTLRRAGWTHREIAGEIQRTEKGVKARIRARLRERIDGAQSETTPAPARETPPAQPTAPPRQADSPAPSTQAPAPDAAAAWTVQRDIQLVEELGKGRKCAAVAEDLGVTKAEAAARFRALCPQPGPDTQKRVLEQLRERASMQAAE